MWRPWCAHVLVRACAFLNILIVKELVEGIAARFVAIQVMDVAKVGTRISNGEYLAHRTCLDRALDVVQKGEVKVDEISVLSVSSDALELPGGWQSILRRNQSVSAIVVRVAPVLLTVRWFILPVDALHDFLLHGRALVLKYCHYLAACVHRRRAIRASASNKGQKRNEGK